MKKCFLSLFALVFGSALTVSAQADLDTLAAKNPLTISGYVDTYYQYNLNDPADGTNTGRIFDLPHNTFSLGLIQTVLTYSVDRLTVVADLTFGPNAELGNFGNTGTASIIKQAYASYAFTNDLTFTVGQFGTHIGYELIDAPLNYNYSLSYLFGNGPFYHTGAKLDYTINNKVGVMVGVLNGWDALIDYNDKKSIAAQISLAPAEGFDLYLNWIGGDEYGGGSAFGSTPGSYASLFDLTTSYQLTPDFLVGVNAAYGSFTAGDQVVPEDLDAPWGDDATWNGVALYLNYSFNEMFGLGLRGEQFNDPEGVRYFGPLEVTALTLTGDIKLAGERFLIKPELRYDKAKDPFFVGSDGVLKDSQATIGAAFVAKF